MKNFQPHIRKELDRFAELIANLEEDYIIIMARKAIRLYELLIKNGARATNKTILSQRVLEDNLDWAEGQSIAIIDDTLIVGTTIKDAVEALTNSKAKIINTYVFCVDKEYWVKEYIQPNKIFMKLSDKEVMSFCAAEVSAFDANGIPYISDFPISNEIEIPNINTLNIIPKWRAYQITTRNQEKEGRHTITFLPDGDLHSEIEEKLGTEFYRLIDILKVRAIGKLNNGKLTFCLIPIVTLKPLAVSDLNKLFFSIICALDSDDILRNVHLRITSAKGKLRCIQYILSIVFGRVFMEHFGLVLKSRRSLNFSEKEVFRNYGPWLINEFRHITATATKRLWRACTPFIENISPAEYPEVVRSIVNTEIAETTMGESIDSRNIITDISRLFIRLHNDHEIPARIEAKAFANSTDDTAHSSKHRDRLKIGFPWRLIVDYLCELYHKNTSIKYSNLFSLALDFWNDKGVSVPIICETNGVIFRAYRHGESAPYSNQEAGLCWVVLQSYFEEKKIESIQHTDLLKILVILFRSGMKNGYIDVITGASGSAGVARIGYHLHGAIPFVTDDQNNIYADNREEWITKYLVAQKVITQNKNKAFELGIKPVANYYKHDSEEYAKDLGLYLGHFMSHNEPSSNETLLTSQDLIKIATCSDLASMVAAVNAELRIINKQYHTKFRHSFTNVNFDIIDNITETLKELRDSDLYTALHSSKMKILAYEQGEVIAVLKKCESYLLAGKLGAAQARSWNRIMSFCELDQSSMAVNDLLPTHRIQKQQLLLLFAAIYTIEYALLNLTRNAKVTEFKRVYRMLEKKVNDIISDFGSSDAEAPLKIIHRIKMNMSIDANIEAFDSRSSFKWAASLIQDNISEIHDQISISSRTLADYQSDNEPRTYYDHILWYDIIDSTATKLALSATSDAVKRYKANVSRFRDSVSRRLSTICEEYSTDGNSICPWNGTVESKNDEKHIFFSGKDRVLATLKTLGALVSIAKQCPGVRFRAILVACDFTGDSYASSTPTSAEVEGEVFLTHFDRLKKAIREEELILKDDDIKLFLPEAYRGYFLKDLIKIGLYGEREFKITTTEGLRTNKIKMLGANIKLKTAI